MTAREYVLAQLGITEKFDTLYPDGIVSEKDLGKIFASLADRLGYVAKEEAARDASDSWDEGYNTGRETGYEEGNDDGFDNGYDKGYSDGIIAERSRK